MIQCRYQVLTFDNWGRGHSNLHENGKFGLLEFCQQLESVINEAKATSAGDFQEVHLVGHSMGGK